MADIVSQQKRSKMMSGISGKNTKPELIVRRGLHARGFRYSLHSPKLPGKPDLYLRKYKVAIFVNGCFWHAHKCSLFKLPKSNREFWSDKLEKNAVRDKTNHQELQSYGYRAVSYTHLTLPTILLV